MGFLNVADLVLHYEDQGRGDPVLFLHGLGGRGLDWAPQLERFASSHRVLAPDCCGHGSSSKPKGPYSVAAFAGHAAELIRQAVGGPVHVVGLSMGGMTAFQLAVDHPDLVRTLTIVNSGPELIARNLKERFALWSRIAIVRLRGLRAMADIIAPRLFPGPDRAGDRRRYVEQFVTNDRDSYLASLRAIIGWSVADRIGAITVPTLVVASELDYTPAERKAEYVRRMPDARMVVVPGVHHAFPIEDPDTFNRILAEFLEIPATAAR